MTEDSIKEREKIADFLGYDSFDEISNEAHQKDIDADDYLIKLIYNKLNKHFGY